ncbi:pre-mRNA-processing factor 17 [Homalodisca vitripennis]|nr:pre-mRNA-processing factor 17 [Homalodisca vitripennis]
MREENEDISNCDSRHKRRKKDVSRSGHSFLPCDRAFGTAKRHIRKRDRIYTPDEYNLLIAKFNENIEVLETQNGDIVDYTGRKNITKKLYYQRGTLQGFQRIRRLPSVSPDEDSTVRPRPTTPKVVVPPSSSEKKLGSSDDQGKSSEEKKESSWRGRGE